MYISPFEETWFKNCCPVMHRFAQLKVMTMTVFVVYRYLSTLALFLLLANILQQCECELKYTGLGIILRMNLEFMYFFLTSLFSLWPSIA